jgi:hypothetical protein
MHTFLDSKIMAKALRAALAERRIDVTHSDSLELVARQFGFDNWNILAARIDAWGTAELPVPNGWRVHHAAPFPLHRVGLDPAEPGTVKIASTSSPDVVGGYHATLMQSIAAGDYRGTTLRLSAELRSEDAARGTLWMRVDPRGGGKSIRFDNMLTRTVDGPLVGTSGWTERSIVLDVPNEADSIHYGPMLVGSGQLWARRVRLEPVAADSPVTTIPNYLPRPTNLDFGNGAAA